MRKSTMEKLKEAKKRESPQLILSSLEEFYASLLGGPALPTQGAFINGTEFCRGYKGPAGCAKTTTLAALGWGRALLVPGSKIFVSRNNYNDIMDTTLTEFQRMLDKLPKEVLLDRDKSPPMKWYIRPAVIDGQPDDLSVSQFTFQGLTDALGSIQATCWLVDEADEVEEARAREILSRLRAPGDPRDYAACFVFNPPPKTHWLYKACTGKDHQDVKVGAPWMALYEPQPNENVKNLPKGYYENLLKHLAPDQAQRLVHGLWGSVFPGEPVFREFKEYLHCNPTLEYNPDAPLFRFWDFGYNRPCCHWAQLSPLGHLYVLRTELGYMEEVEPFSHRVKAITNQYFPAAKDITDYGDPAVKQHKDTGNALAKLHAAGIQINYRSSSIDEGLTTIRNLLNRMIDGKPILQFHPRWCGPLVDALKGGYHLDKLGEKPKKDGFYDHPMDAFRYGIINLFAGFGMQTNRHTVPDDLSYQPE